jgi:hypothetical protein
MAKEPLTTRLDADTKRQVENYADEHDIGQTEAARRLIRAGLAEEGYPVAAADGRGPTTRTKETVYGWLERSVYAMMILLVGMLVTGGSAIAFGTTLLPLKLLALGVITASVTAIASAGIWFAIEFATDSTTAESEVTP